MGIMHVLYSWHMSSKLKQVRVCVCVCVCMYVLELFQQPQHAAAAWWNHLHTIEQLGKPPSNRDGFGGFSLSEGEVLKHKFSHSHMHTR